MDENLLKRVLPHSIEAEQSVIGAVLMDPECISSIADMISEDDFYSKQYGIMFGALIELYNDRRDIDLVTLQDKLKEKDVPPEVSSLEYVKDILNTVPTSANVKSYANIVYEKSMLRRLIRSCEHITDISYAGNDSLDAILDESEKDIFNVLQSKTSSEFTPIRQVAMTALQRIQKASETKEVVTGVPTGFSDLDYKTSGLQPSDFVLVAARPSMGKTAFVLNIIEHVCMKKNMPAIIFSLEMSKEQLVNRLFAMESHLDAQKIRTGQIYNEEWSTLVDAVAKVSKSNLIIDDTPGISIGELRSKCRRMKLEHGLSLIVIDYLQLMSAGSKRNENRQQEISEISRNLKALAREMEAPVIALSQLSRACESRPDHRPMLSDLRESGAIEQDADLVMFIYRDDYYNKDSEHPGEAEIIIAKQRNGPIGTVNLAWLAETTRFANMERQ